MTLRCSQEVCEDILCTAFEGGINYWAEDIAPTREKRDGDLGWAYTGGRVGYDDGDGELRGKDITCEKVAHGIATIMQAGIEEGKRIVRPSTYQYILEALVSGDTGMIDADIADTIVQVALFGEVVYG